MHQTLLQSSIAVPSHSQPTSKRMAQRLPQDYDSWKLGSPQPNKAGGKSVPIHDKDGNPVTLFTDQLRAPFDAVGYNDPEAARVNLCLEANEAIIRWNEGVDAHMLTLLEARSLELFGKRLSAAELRANYHSAIRDPDKYGSQLLKLKMTKAGSRGTVRVWNEAGIARGQPASWQDCQVQAKAVLKGLWVQGRNFGLTWEAVDVMIKAEGDVVMECPF